MKSFAYWFEQLRRSLRYSKREIGDATGLSKSTTMRLARGRTRPSRQSLEAMVRMAAKHDLNLAREMARSCETTIEALGVKASASATTGGIDDPQVEAVLFAGARRSSAPAREMVPVLRTVFARMRELGLSIEAMERALAKSTGSDAAK